MNYRHTYLSRNALKLTYGNLGSKKFPGEGRNPAKTPGYAYDLVRQLTMDKFLVKTVKRPRIDKGTPTGVK